MADWDEAEEGAWLLTSGDIARLAGVDIKTVHGWVNRGHLVGYRTSGGHLRFHRPEVVRYCRDFDCPLPKELGKSPARVALVGVGDDRRVSGTRLAVRSVSFVHFSSLFDAVMVLGSGYYEVVAVGLARYSIELVAELLETLRANPQTTGIGLIGISTDASAREAFVAHGGDIAIADETELRNAVRWLTGAGGPPAEYDAWVSTTSE